MFFGKKSQFIAVWIVFSRFIYIFMALPSLTYTPKIYLASIQYLVFLLIWKSIILSDFFLNFFFNNSHSHPWLILQKLFSVNSIFSCPSNLKIDYFFGFFTFFYYFTLLPSLEEKFYINLLVFEAKNEKRKYIIASFSLFTNFYFLLFLHFHLWIAIF